MPDATKTGAAKNDAAALAVRGLCKSYQAVRALHEVSMSVHYGGVTALLGDNGAGKSTLIKCMAGMQKPDAGEVLVDGVAREFASPKDARALGVETVHQVPGVVDTLNAVENLFLGREILRAGRIASYFGVLDKRRMRAECEATLGKLDIRIPSLLQPLANLSGGQRQAVAIGRAVAWGQRIVLLDEPTAALGVEQTARVLQLIGRLRAAGVAVLLITHDMQCVFAACDRAVVLRHGQKCADVKVAEVDKDELVGFITGAKTAVDS